MIWLVINSLFIYPTLIPHKRHPDGLINVTTKERLPTKASCFPISFVLHPCQNSQIQSARYAPQTTKPAINAPCVLAQTNINSGKRQMSFSSPLVVCSNQ